MIATIIGAIAVLAIICKGVFVLNRMGCGTRHGIRWAWILMTVAAAGVLLADMHATWPHVIFQCAVAAVVVFDRRTIFCWSRHETHG